jgi:lipoprotein-anchoring transpeptidase ErfK/SrfK
MNSPGAFLGRGARRAVSVMAVLGLLVSAPYGLAVASEETEPDAAVVAAVPAAPVIVDVVAGDQSAIVTYTPVEDPSVTGYQVSPDGYHWFDCPDVSGLCGLTSLTNGREYRVSLRAVGPAGQSVPASAISTIPVVGVDPDKPNTLPKPRSRVTATFKAAGNSLGVSGARTKLGVGTLPTLTFSRDIPNKAAVERHLAVTATRNNGRTTNVPGAWGWLDERTAMFRPKEFWPGNSIIRITSTLDDAVLGKSKGRYLVGSKKLGKTYSFQTDRSFIAVVDGAKKVMNVYIDGKKRKTFKVSLGKYGWETRNGAKVISTAKEADKIYRSSSLGLDEEEEFYELPAKWNTRLTPTGEFLHTATWAYGRLGRYNGSHGCTNMFENDAKWIYDNTIPGDVVDYVKTGGDLMEPWNGPGGRWNIPWNRWLKRSALNNASGKADTSEDEGSLADARPDGA